MNILQKILSNKKIFNEKRIRIKAKRALRKKNRNKHIFKLFKWNKRQEKISPEEKIKHEAVKSLRGKSIADAILASGLGSIVPTQIV